jgi:chromosome segregation ATPase
MTSNIENELKAQVSEFAKSDEALKEIIGRLSELEGLIAANQKSRDSLDKATASIEQLASNLGTFLKLSVDSVGNISKVSTDIGSSIQRIEADIAEMVAKSLKEGTNEIRHAISHFETVARKLSDDFSNFQNQANEIESNLIRGLNKLKTGTFAAIGALATFVTVLIYFI